MPAGVARVILQAALNAPTQPAILRATDLTTGNSGDRRRSPSCSRPTDRRSCRSYPATATITGPDTQTCSFGFRVDYFIYGGTPPYHVSSTFPDAVTLVNPTVFASGGFFEAITNGTCVKPLTFTIVDAIGRQTTATLNNIPGTAAPPPPPATGDHRYAGFYYGRPGSQQLLRQDLQFRDQRRHATIQRCVCRWNRGSESGHDVAGVVHHQQLRRRVGSAHHLHRRCERASADRDCIGDLQVAIIAGREACLTKATAPSGAVFFRLGDERANFRQRDVAAKDRASERCK